MLTKSSLVLALGLCTTLVASQTIQRIETLTADEGGAQMTFGEVQLDIYTFSGTSCTIDRLEADGNDFQQGALDVFQGRNNPSKSYCLIIDFRISQA